MEPETLRLIERLLIACGGILSIWLGFRLFYIAGVKDGASGSFKSVAFNATLTRVGPGAFFALFGAFVLHAGLMSPVSTSKAVPSSAAAMELSFWEQQPDVDRLRRAVERIQDAELRNQLLPLVNAISFRRNFFGHVPPDEQPQPQPRLTPRLEGLQDG